MRDEVAMNRQSTPGVLLLLLGSTLLLSGCGVEWPWRHDSTSPPPPPPAAGADAPTGDALKAECDQLSSDIRHNRELAREAPALSSTPEIVQASEAKADQRIAELQTRYDQLDCHDEDAASGLTPPKTAPLPPAPGSPPDTGR
jgi:hypothetical protein